MFQPKTNKKKHQSIKIKHEIPNKKHYQLKTTYMFMQHGFKFGFLNLFCAWTGPKNSG
jgi:hypothetical protein